MSKYLEEQAKLMYPEYFEDKTKLATPYSMAVPLAYRGKGLASVINEATVQ